MQLTNIVIMKLFNVDQNSSNTKIQDIYMYLIIKLQ